MIVKWHAPRADKVSKIVLKFVQEDLDKLCKKSYWGISRFLYEFFYDWNNPLQQDTINRYSHAAVEEYTFIRIFWLKFVGNLAIF